MLISMHLFVVVGDRALVSLLSSLVHRPMLEVRPRRGFVPQSRHATCGRGRGHQRGGEGRHDIVPLYEFMYFILF